MTSGERPTSARTPGSPDAATRGELLDQAAALDDEAITYRGGGPKADTLRRRAAELRVEALGPKPYPVEICTACFHLTGWVGADGACAADLWLRRERADPNRLGTPDLRQRRAADRVSFLRRVKRSLGVSTPDDRRREWRAKIDPGQTGPIEPEEGWSVESPVRSEGRAPEGPDLIVSFDVQSYRFEYGAWREVDVSPSGKPRRLVPREFAASLDIAALAEAWADFTAEVDEHDRRIWERETARRDAIEREAQELRDAEAQRGTSDLLG
jgi:hypothetical protein